MARSEETSEDQRDLLLIGPETRIQITAFEAATAEDPPLVAVIEQGTVRALDRRPGQAAAMHLKTGERLIHLQDADAVIEYDAASDTALHLVDQGSIMVEAGRRQILLKNGMVRQIKDGQILGARRMEQEQWQELSRRTDVEGVQIARASEAAPAEAGGLSTGNVAPPKPVKEDYVYVRMHTTAGDIDLRLDRARAPITVDNFMSYVDKGFYEGTIFHRVIGDFMIQGGGFDQNLTQKPTDPPIRNEWQNGLKNERGSIAMARIGGQRDSATAQFFINVVDNARLDAPQADGAAYAVFGQVVGGMDVVDRIRQVETRAATAAHRDVPVEPIIIEQVEKISREDAQGEGA
jgi:cyclophilin family peptidyl-prolyl cis-trans isomerase